MKVLITGANGMLGQDLCPTLEDLGCFLIETDADSLDITKEESIEKIIKLRPDLIIHLAAYTNVDKAEEEPELAELINAKGTENIAMAAGNLDIPMIYISTDYVFDGTKNSPYLPLDETNPKSVYGKTKLMGEAAVQKHCKKYYIARTSWLYGMYGKNFVDTMLKLKDKEELKVVDDQIGTPTWTMDLSGSLMQLLDKPYGIYHLSGGGKPTSWYNFAKTIFELTNNKVNLTPCTSDEYPQKAERPRYSVMDNNKMLRDWKLALKDYLALTYEE